MFCYFRGGDAEGIRMGCGGTGHVPMVGTCVRACVYCVCACVWACVRARMRA